MALADTIRGLLAGKKTYIIALLAAGSAVMDWAASGGGMQELVNAVWLPLAAMTGKAGFERKTRLREFRK